MISNILAAIDWNDIVAGALIGLSAGFAAFIVGLRAWNALCRRNELYDREVIRRSQDCNLNDSAGHPANPHPRPAAVKPVVSACEREAVGISKPTAAGTSLPKRPDGTEDLDAAGLGAWVRQATRRASEYSYRRDYHRALETLQEAEHGLRCLMLEQRADNAGVAR